MRTNRVFLAPAVAALLIAAACSGQMTPPTEPQGSSVAAPGILLSSSGDSNGQVTFVSCTPLAAQTASASMGILGGSINIGPHSLVVPPGALLGPTTITASILANDSTNSVQFYPAGLQFRAPAELMLSYANCNKPELKMSLVYMSDDLLDILELLPALDNPVKKLTIGVISHFSRYAMAF